MIITIAQIKSALIDRVNYSDDDELIEIYQQLTGKKVINHGDIYFPCYEEIYDTIHTTSTESRPE